MQPKTPTSTRRRSAFARSRGLTLLELMAALALACLLLAGMTGIVRLLKTQQDELNRRRAPSAAQRRLASTLERDLANSRQIWMSRDRRTLRLQGFGTRTGLLHGLGEIRYQIVKLPDNMQVLLRVERHPTETTGASSKVDVAAWDVAMLSLRRLEVADRLLQPAHDVQELKRERGILPETWIAVPDEAIACLWSPDGKLRFSSIIVVR